MLYSDIASTLDMSEVFLTDSDSKIPNVLYIFNFDECVLYIEQKIGDLYTNVTKDIKTLINRVIVENYVYEHLMLVDVGTSSRYKGVYSGEEFDVVESIIDDLVSLSDAMGKNNGISTKLVNGIDYLLSQPRNQEDILSNVKNVMVDLSPYELNWIYDWRCYSVRQTGNHNDYFLSVMVTNDTTDEI